MLRIPFRPICELRWDDSADLLREITRWIRLFLQLSRHFGRFPSLWLDLTTHIFDILEVLSWKISSACCFLVPSGWFTSSVGGSGDIDMNKFQRKEAREVNKLLNSYEGRMNRLLFLVQSRTSCTDSGKRFDLNLIKTHYFKKLRRQYRKEVTKLTNFKEKKLETSIEWLHITQFNIK